MAWTLRRHVANEIVPKCPSHGPPPSHLDRVRFPLARACFLDVFWSKRGVQQTRRSCQAVSQKSLRIHAEMATVSIGLAPLFLWNLVGRD